MIVLRNGRICKEFERGELTEADILREAIGDVKMPASQFDYKLPASWPGQT